MFRNFIKTTLRVFLKNKVFSVLNILGLSVGIATTLLIFLFVDHEFSYDKFHNDAEHIYRLTESFSNGENYTTTALTAYALGPLCKEKFSGIESYQRMYYAFGNFMTVSHGESEMDITNRYTFTDPGFFEFFSFSLIAGSKEDALQHPNGLVISSSEARKLFGNEDPVGRVVTMTFTYDKSTFDVQVTGVMEDFPDNSHFRYDYLMPLSLIAERIPSMKEHWGWTSQHTYLKFKPGADHDEVNESSLKELANTHAPEWFNQWAYFSIQPMLDIHLKSNLKEELQSNSNIEYVGMFMAIAIFIVLIACINYMNLSTSLATQRAKEVAMKKVVGANKMTLICQFLGESVVMVIISMVLAITIAQISLPYFNELANKQFELTGMHWSYYAICMTFTLFIGLLAGSYPAFLLSSMKSISTMKSSNVGVGSVTNLRKALVVLQFSISIILIISTIIIFNQWEFLQKRDLGINTDDIIVIPLKTRESRRNLSLLKTEWSKIHGVTSVGASTKSLSERFDNFMLLRTEDSDENLSFPNESVDYNFFEVLNAQLIDGRNFSSDFSADSSRIVINQSAAGKLQLEDPVGKIVVADGGSLEIIGLVRDFHFESLHHDITPMVFFVGEESLSQVYMKINAQNIRETITVVEQSWKNLGMSQEFEYQFLDQERSGSYFAEEKFLTIFTTFSILAIIIACLGIFGLAAFTAERRTKEIGIRKTLGASTFQMMFMLSSEFTKLILLANLIAWPLAYLIMAGWLENFAYRIMMSPLVFILGAALTLSIAILTVSSQSIRAASTNPASALKYE